MCPMVISMVEMVLALVALLLKIFLFLLIFNGETVIRNQASLSAQFMFIKDSVVSSVSLSSCRC